MKNPFEYYSEHWFGFIHAHKLCHHLAFQRWALSHMKEINSVLEIGCGKFLYYPMFFRGTSYTGLDANESCVDYCTKTTRTMHYYPMPKYIHAPMEKYKSDIKYDLVFGHAVIDHTSDIEYFIRNAVFACKRYLYLSAYRGYFETNKFHKQIKEGEDYYNDLAVKAIMNQLLDLGCKNVSVQPLATGLPKPEIQYEAIITAEVEVDE